MLSSLFEIYHFSEPPQIISKTPVRTSSGDIWTQPQKKES